MAKNIILKAQYGDLDSLLELPAMRNTPTQRCSTSPAQRSMGQRACAILPTHTELLKPAGATEEEGLIWNKERQAANYNWNEHGLEELQVGDTVRVRPLGKHDGMWSRAEVIEVYGQQSYKVQTGGAMC